jgi:hypothetical protein
MLGYLRRPIRRRWDWRIGVSVTRSTNVGSVRAWGDIEFPGRRPARVAEAQPICPPDGYAADRLRSWPDRRRDSDLVRVFLTDFLHQCGYHDIHDAVEDVAHSLG